MKKFLSLSLVLVLVLAMGAMAFAAEGTLEGGATVGEEINVQAYVGQYAELIVVKGINFNRDEGHERLLGKPGLYAANGIDAGSVQFYKNAAVKMGIPDATETDLPIDLYFEPDNLGYGKFTVEANTPVTVAVTWESEERERWLDSKTLFAVAEFGAPDQQLAWIGTFPYFSTVNGNQFDVPFVANKVREYGVDGAIWIERISQQLAQKYETNLTLTVSAQ